MNYNVLTVRTWQPALWSNELCVRCIYETTIPYEPTSGGSEVILTQEITDNFVINLVNPEPDCENALTPVTGWNNLCMQE